MEPNEPYTNQQSKIAGYVVEVAVDLPIIERTFYYRVPPEIGVISPGSAVLISFSGRKVLGYVIGNADAASADIKPDKILEIEELLIPGVVSESLLALAKWMSNRYFCSSSSAVKLTLPPNLKSRLVAEVRLTQKGLAALEGKSVLNSSEHALLSSAKGDKTAESNALLLKDLLKQGYLEKTYRLKAKRRKRQPAAPISKNAGSQPPAYTTEQTRAIEAILNGPPGQYLLEGITGSGKTEVYMALIDHLLAQGKGSIVLVPEIALTGQTVTTIQDRFGEVTALYHSGLTPAQRMNQWKRIKDGEASIVVGTRSALFTPVNNLGLVVIDEEHEPSYKNNMSPRYQARETAAQRCSLEKASLLLGSATPSLEARSSAGGYHHRITSRAAGGQLPEIIAVDLRNEKRSGNLSEILRRELKAVLAQKEKAILFLNRRGFSHFLQCGDCGQVIKCPRCEISLTYHRTEGILKCHHCNLWLKAASRCASCGSRRLLYRGSGIQQIEEELSAEFPGTPVIRLDADVVASSSYVDRLRLFEQEETAILLGTQMIAKGLHFPQVTLVGVIDADTSLYIPDFRSAERAFQLLVQVSGRAGRGDRPGKVVVQTRTPGHYAIASFINGDWDGFYEKELGYRKEAGYPPETRLLNLVISGLDKEKAEKRAEEIGTVLTEASIAGIREILGPAPAPFEKIKGWYRFHLLLKIEDEAALGKIRPLLLPLLSMRKDLKVIADYDPASLL